MKAAPLLKPSHPAVRAYYDALTAYAAHGAAHEGATETAFSRLLADTATSVGWTLIPKQALKAAGKTIFPDGTLRDAYNLPRGYWEAKDIGDDLDAEIGKKIDKKYPLTNIIFENTRRAVLYQNGAETRRFDLTDAQQLADLLNQFYTFAEPDIEGFEQAIAEFKERVPELAGGLDEKVKQAHATNNWVIDQYRVSEDARSGIRSDPNRPDDAEYIVRLVGQVIRVSVETVKIVAGLPAEFAT